MSTKITAEAQNLKPIPDTQEILERQYAMAFIAAVMRKTDHAELRFRFSDLWSDGLTIWHDVATDEVVFLLKSMDGKP